MRMNTSALAALTIILSKSKNSEVTRVSESRIKMNTTDVETEYDYAEETNCQPGRDDWTPSDDAKRWGNNKAHRSKHRRTVQRKIVKASKKTNRRK